MSFIKHIFTRNYERYEGVRPIQIFLLRLFYFLMVIGVAPDAWRELLTHQGPWDHVRAVAWCVWAAYTTMAVFGIMNPLRMLPIMVFMIFYKTLWVITIALPLWRANALVGSPAEAMSHVFGPAPLLAFIVPWGYFFRNFVMWQRRIKSSSPA